MISQEKLQQWVNDLQSGLYINCVYCGLCYGPQNEEIPQEMLRRHVAECPEHPMAQLIMDCKTIIANIENRRECLGYNGSDVSHDTYVVLGQLKQAVTDAETFTTE